MEVTMILRFGFRNFLSFDEGVECSFESDDGKINTLLNVKGANGAGKTNLLKALAFFMDFVANSFVNLKPEDSIGVVPFFDSSKPSEFFIEFTIDEISYIYELIVSKKEIVKECLSRKNKRYVHVFTREHDAIKKCITEFKELENLKCRKNASVISIAHQNEIECLNSIYNVFYRCVSNVSMTHSTISMFFDCAEEYGKQALSDISNIYYKDKNRFAEVKKFIVESDIGISDIVLKEEQMVDGSTIFVPSFCHEVEGKKHFLPYKSESRGTQFLYINLFFFLFAIARPSSLLLFDELDMGLHPLLVKKIISLYKQHDIHNCGQIIFTTHNTTILDELKSDETLLLNKENNESYGYLISECSSAIIRKDRNIRTPYEQGRIGGVPKL